MILFQNQVAAHQYTAVGLYGVVHGVVGGGQHNNALAGLSKGLNRVVECVDHAGGAQNPLGLDLPVVALLLPLTDGLLIFVGGIGIAQNIAVDVLLQPLANLGGDLKLHVRHREGDDILVGRDAEGGHFIPFSGTYMIAGGAVFKVISHDLIRSFLIYGGIVVQYHGKETLYSIQYTRLEGRNQSFF